MSDEREGLQFACECVSSGPAGYSDPWAAVARHKLLPDGTKEEIINVVAREPKTISQLAAELGLSAPSVHTHVSDMLRSELLREAVEWEKMHPSERYYEPNIPVVLREERAQFEAICRELSERVADLFERRQTALGRAFAATGLGARGWQFADLTQYLYACVQRGARELLEERGVLAPPKAHGNGVGWCFWAEEPGGRED